MSALHCPSCGAAVSPRDFQCGKCELLLLGDLGDPDEVTEPSLVRQLLSVPQNRPGKGVPARSKVGRHPNPWELEVTAPAPFTFHEEMVPQLVGGVDVALSPLHPFEAYVASFLDGRHTLAEVAHRAGLGNAEVKAVLMTLVAKGVAHLHPILPIEPKTAPERPRNRAARGRLSQGRKPTLDGQQKALDGPATLLHRAVNLERTGDFDGAVKVLEEGIAALEQPAPLYNRLALTVINQRRDYALAQDLLKRACQLEPENEIYEQNLMKVVTLATLDAGEPSRPRKAK